jgi:hypothetical protein
MQFGLFGFEGAEFSKHGLAVTAFGNGTRHVGNGSSHGRYLFLQIPGDGIVFRNQSLALLAIQF